MPDDEGQRGTIYPVKLIVGGAAGMSVGRGVMIARLTRVLLPVL
jgi:hypothetical protein